MSLKEKLEYREEWLKTCKLCHKLLKLGEKLVGSIEKQVAYHEKCYEHVVLNFGNEAERQDYFKMMKGGT